MVLLSGSQIEANLLAKAKVSKYLCDTLPSYKKCWGGSNLSISDKYKFYFTNLSDIPTLEMLNVEVRFLPAAELNFYSDTML